MPVYLKDNQSGIPLTKLRDGQLAVIISWPDTDRIGNIVIKSETDGSIPLHELHDSQVAMARACNTSAWLGRVVQRCDTTLIFLGGKHRESVRNAFGDSGPRDVLVEILPEGTELVVKDNQ